MLAEEEFYSGRPSTSSTVYTSKYADSSSSSSWRKHSPTSTTKGKHQETKKRKSSDDWSGKSKRTASEGKATLTSHKTSCLMHLCTCTPEYALTIRLSFLNLSDARWNTKLSSVDLPSHNTRWTIEEDERLREGLVRFLFLKCGQYHIYKPRLNSNIAHSLIEATRSRKLEGDRGCRWYTKCPSG